MKGGCRAVWHDHTVTPRAQAHVVTQSPYPGAAALATLMAASLRYGSGRVPMRDMMPAGLVVNILGWGVIIAVSAVTLRWLV